MIYTFGKDFGIGLCDYDAVALDEYAVCEDGITSGKFDYTATYTRTHTSGWTISGKIQVDHFEWVSVFTAIHPQWGKIVADLDEQIEVESAEAYEHFFANHPTYVINWLES
jgi:hypothetical protein